MCCSLNSFVFKEVPRVAPKGGRTLAQAPKGGRTLAQAQKSYTFISYTFVGGRTLVQAPKSYTFVHYSISTLLFKLKEIIPLDLL